jgi:hypothetical protein
MSPQTTAERLAACGAVLFGMTVSAMLAVRSPAFLANFLWYWAPQATVIALLWPLKPRPAALAGVAIMLALYLSAFGWWLLSRERPDSLAWLGYLFSFPGAAASAVAAVIWLRGHRVSSALLVASVAAGTVLVGIVVNQTIVCSTVMYCGAR